MERSPSAAMRECLRLLQQFADGHLSVSEFEHRYWTARSRCLHADAATQSPLESARGFEQDLSRYVPDPLPQIRHVEERELRRRAWRALERIDPADHAAPTTRLFIRERVPARPIGSGDRRP